MGAAVVNDAPFDGARGSGSCRFIGLGGGDCGRGRRRRGRWGRRLDDDGRRRAGCYSVCLRCGGGSLGVRGASVGVGGLVLSLGSCGLLGVGALALRGGERHVGKFGGMGRVVNRGVLGVMRQFIFGKMERGDSLSVKARRIARGANDITGVDPGLSGSDRLTRQIGLSLSKGSGGKRKRARGNKAERKA